METDTVGSAVTTGSSAHNDSNEVLSSYNSSSCSGYGTATTQSFAQAFSGASAPALSNSVYTHMSSSDYVLTSAVSHPMTMLLPTTNTYASSSLVTSVQTPTTTHTDTDAQLSIAMLPTAAAPMVSTTSSYAVANANAGSTEIEPATDSAQQRLSLQGQSSDATLNTQWQALKARRWTRGKDLTAFVQDLALQTGKRALVATSGGSYKKFVCSSAPACPWLLHAVCSRVRKRPPNDGSDDSTASGRHWYVTSGHLVHASDCLSAAKPTARQLKRSALLQTAVQRDARVSSAVLVERLRTDANVACSKSMVYKAKTELLDELAQQRSTHAPVPTYGNGSGSDSRFSMSGSVPAAVPMYDPAVVAATQQLPSYLMQMAALNAHVLGRVERDASGCLLRAVLALDPTRVWSGQCVLGIVSSVDHTNGGTELVLVGRDGDLATVVHAVALVPDASALHCAWFLAQLLAHGFPLRRVPLFTPGGAAWAAATAAQQIRHTLQSVRHVIAEVNCTLAALAAPPLQPEDEALVTQMQRAESESEFTATLEQLALRHAKAAQQLRMREPAHWALYPNLAVRKLYGWQTPSRANIVDVAFCGTGDSAMAEFGLKRSISPLAFFQARALALMSKAFARHEQAEAWEHAQRVITPAAERMLHDELAQAPQYRVAMSAPLVAFVWRANTPQLRQRRVDLQQRACTCALRRQWGVPCRHVLAALQHTGRSLALAYDCFDDCYRVRSFAAANKGRHLELPLDDALQRDLTLLPAPFMCEADRSNGADKDATSNSQATTTTHDADAQDAQLSIQRPPKKRRARNRPLVERKRGIYKCHACNRAEGHNKGTCPYIPADLHVATAGAVGIEAAIPTAAGASDGVS